MIDYSNEASYKMELERIIAKFDGRSLLTVSDVSRYTGKSREWVRKHLGVSGREGITAVNLAIRLTELNRRTADRSE